MGAESVYERLLRLIDLERSEGEDRAREATAGRGPLEREAGGAALARLARVEVDAGLGGRFLLVLRRTDGSSLPPGTFTTGDAVLLSRGDPASDEVTRGVVALRTARSITVALDDPPPDWTEEGRLVLDRRADETTQRRMRTALDRVRGARRVDRLSEFRDLADGRRSPGDAPARRPAVPPVLEGLDASQREAADFALQAQRLALVHGPPGTGKTTTLAAVVREAVRRGERVLAAAPSNAAVDHLAEVLVEQGLRVVRLGHPARMTEALRGVALEERVRGHEASEQARLLVREAWALRRRVGKYRRARPAPGEREAARAEARARIEDARRLERQAVEAVFDDAEVVAGTLAGTAMAALGERRFDLAVIDEAAQALEPATWIPLLRADRAVLAGDHCQLPPTVTSPEAASQGLAITLFERLHRAHGEAIARMLTVQYRMHEAIAAFSNARFYGGRLVSHASVAGHLLSGLRAAAPWTETPVTLIDTSGCGWEEERPGGGPSVANPGEADLLARVAGEILGAGLPPVDLGIIAPYAAQVALLRDRLAEACAQGLEIDSVDAFQGREKEAILFSLVRSNASGEVGFLSDERRTNVALTRARRCLVVVGDGATVCRHPFYRDLWEHYEAAGFLRSAWEWG